MRLKWALVSHAILIREFGGTDGVRDMHLLESALFRPHATFDGIDPYPTPVEKAAAILESIVINHPFLDGNKRTGYSLMRSILLQHDIDVDVAEEVKHEFVIEVSEGKHTIDSIKSWINKYLIQLSQ